MTTTPPSTLHQILAQLDRIEGKLDQLEDALLDTEINREQAATILGCSERTVSRMHARGEIEQLATSARTGRYWLREILRIKRERSQSGTARP